jgi:AraC-like DNA-binding protein
MAGRLLRITNWEKLAKEAEFQPAKMAAFCHISLRQLERFFTAHFKKTPTTWTRQLRCSLAKELLAKGYSNRAVTEELKFSNESHLCHEFKKLYGTSPQSFGPAYRSRLKMSPNDKNVA